jgi:2-oxoisovalerate dehydrogenase E2 component (dihydrolipoyl transacylase)
MAVHVIKVPDVGEGIAEVELVAWHVKPGDTVAEDQALADVMTDKASVEIPSPWPAAWALGGAVGQMLAVGAELIRNRDGWFRTSDRRCTANASAAASGGQSLPRHQPRRPRQRQSRRQRPRTCRNGRQSPSQPSAAPPEQAHRLAGRAPPRLGTWAWT